MIEGLWIAFTIVLMHWWADFVLQKDEWAKNKSKSWTALLKHTCTYSLVWLLWVITVLSYNYQMHDTAELSLLWFPLITFVAHTITDAITSRITSRLYAEGRVHDFFVMIGFDQVLHYAQLFLTYVMLTG
jgi:hypothetical protein